MPSPPASTFAVLDLARARAGDADADADADVAIALLAREDETWTRVDVRRGRFPSDALTDALAGVVVVGGRKRVVDDARASPGGSARASGALAGGVRGDDDDFDDDFDDDDVDADAIAWLARARARARSVPLRVFAAGARARAIARALGKTRADADDVDSGTTACATFRASTFRADDAFAAASRALGSSTGTTSMSTSSAGLETSERAPDGFVATATRDGRVEAWTSADGDAMCARRAPWDMIATATTDASDDDAFFLAYVRAFLRRGTLREDEDGAYLAARRRRAEDARASHARRRDDDASTPARGVHAHDARARVDGDARAVAKASSAFAAAAQASAAEFDAARAEFAFLAAAHACAAREYDAVGAALDDVTRLVEVLRAKDDVARRRLIVVDAVERELETIERACRAASAAVDDLERRRDALSRRAGSTPT
ncbi:hypothetical protein OT_ostta20g00055 [Ostreococcus tauri]|uniref:Uncharacterized protein n=1 Tax=Ostreococcus tauri TaxID=70448 RepID=A0A096P9D9_OSTTA|nr:hypothetical protein OT_ostta20g00055 [Ostreococcus tauri]CEG00834.1 hypothetical protein OT_ostta20g00055 [Ostreococcus tauri]|eukprot:XP_022840611.1 hypothetical protein OT_ostta20g00055 [Ostreococcus tauri]